MRTLTLEVWDAPSAKIVNKFIVVVDKMDVRSFTVFTNQMVDFLEEVLPNCEVTKGDSGEEL